MEIVHSCLRCDSPIRPGEEEEEEPVPGFKSGPGMRYQHVTVDQCRRGLRATLYGWGRRGEDPIAHLGTYEG
jgi:hypothetical protein